MTHETVLPLPRREENKQRTRDSIRGAAFDLFEQVGFEEATVDEIASRAGVGRRTFFRYYSCKEELLFGSGPFPDILGYIREHLDQGAEPLDAVFQALRARRLYPRSTTPTDRRRRTLRRRFLQIPSVHEYYRAQVMALSADVAGLIRRHRQFGAVPLLPECVAGFVMTVFSHHVDSGSTENFDIDEGAWRHALTTMVAGASSSPDDLATTGSGQEDLP